MVNFSFVHHETRKLESQRIIVKSSKVSWPPLLAVSWFTYDVIKITVISSYQISNHLSHRLNSYGK